MEEIKIKRWLSELGKNAYLNGVRFISKRNYPTHQKIIFLLSFPSTSESMLDALYQEWPKNLIICYTKNSSKLAKKYKDKGCQVYPIDNYIVLLRRIIPFIQGAKIVLCDNYFAFLSGVHFSEETKNVQLWHANGAIKRFGLEAEYAKRSSFKDQERYRAVYRTWTHYVVSSDRMKNIFEKNYQIKMNCLNFGYPPTDDFFDTQWLEKSIKIFREKFPTDKKVLLYAPTYREGSSITSSDFKKMIENLQKDWLVLIKCHPHEQERYIDFFNRTDVILDFQGLTLNEVLPSVDCLVTDYSSIPFEYSLANPRGKIVFYCYDYDEYNQKVGIERDFKEWAPGEIVYESQALCRAIQSDNRTSLTDFNQEWNQYANGTAKTQLIEWVKKYNEA